jgi:hypothetical protein
VTIRGPEGFSPISHRANPTAGGAFQLAVSNVPAGPRRIFEVEGFDPLGLSTAVGAAVVDVAAGRLTAVGIVLQPTAPGPPVVEAAPAIDAVWASPALLAPGEVAEVGAVAHDPDSADALSYAWTATCGAIAEPSLPVTTWRAPAGPGQTCTATLSVADQRGLSVTTSFALFVR